MMTPFPFRVDNTLTEKNITQAACTVHMDT